MRRDVPCLGLCVLFFSSAAAAQVVKCTDAEGNVTYTDLPCLRSERTKFVDTRAASNVVDHTFIRANKGAASAAASLPPVPVSYLTSSATPAPSSSTSSDVSTVRPFSYTYSPASY